MTLLSILADFDNKNLKLAFRRKINIIQFCDGDFIDFTVAKLNYINFVTEHDEIYW